MTHAIQRRLAARQGENKQGGFTLIELMVVVMIIAILVGIAIPAFLGARKRAQDTASKSNLRNGLGTAQTIFTDNQAYLPVADVGTVQGMVTKLGAEEPSLTFVANTADSTSAKTISVLTSGATLDTIVLASKSGSGTCYFLRHVATAGTPGLSGSYINSASGDCSADDAPAAGVTWTAL